MRTSLLAVSLAAIVSAGPTLAIDTGPLGGAAGSATGAVGGASGAVTGTVAGTGEAVGGTAGSAIDGLGGAVAESGGSADTAVGGIGGGTLGGSDLGGPGQTGGAATQGSTGSIASREPAVGATASAGTSPGRGSTVNGMRRPAVGWRASAALLPLPIILLPVPEPGGDPSIRLPGQAAGSPIRLGPLVSRPGTPVAVLDSCRNAIAAAASPYGAARVDVVSAGRAVRVHDGGLAAPVEARILYARRGQFQVRRARVSCRLDAAGTVVAAR
jgi:hypothetical protein